MLLDNLREITMKIDTLLEKTKYPSKKFLLIILTVWLSILFPMGSQGATTIDVIPDFYRSPGISPDREYIGQNFHEYIDPFSGALQLHYIDIQIPGNGGFDLKVERSYNSSSINWITPFNRSSLAGLGWTLHFGRVIKGINLGGICINDNPNTVSNNPVLELPDGSRQILAFTGKSSPLLLTTQRWRADCIGVGTGLTVYAPNGTYYDMSQQVIEMGESSWYPKKITDRNGNFITITYVSNTTAEIASVKASDGRILNFTYAGVGTTSHRVTSIDAGEGQIYYYDYTAIPGVLGGYYLTAVRQPDGRKWQYTYNNLLPNYQAGSYFLKQVTYPEGGSISYLYDFVYFDPQNINPPGRSVVIAKKADSLGGTWSFTYSPGAIGEYDKTVVNSPSGATTYNHIGPNYSKYGTVWMVGLLMKKQIGSIQTETYTWDKQKISDENNFRPTGLFISKFDEEVDAPIMTGKTITRDGASYQTTYSQFDSYGNPQTVTQSGPNGGNRTTTLSYFIDATKWIINQVKNESFSGSSTSRSFDARGNLTILTQNGITTRHTYDSSGNMASTTFPRGLVHSYSDYKRGTPQSEIQPEGINISRTISNAGNLLMERNGEGNVTNYNYDTSNRLISIRPPLGNVTTIAYSPSYSTEIKKTATRGSLQQITTFDGFSRPTSIVLGGITYTYRYDALGRCIFTSNPNSSAGTTYQYDMLDRVTKTTHADGTSQTMAYGAGNRKVTDERGYTTTYAYRAYGDPAQQLLMSVSAPIAAANISLSRNSVDLVTKIIQNGKTRQYGYNSNYYLTSVTYPETGTTTYGRDLAGNMTSRQVGSSGVTTYTYDNQNRLYNVDYPRGTEFVTHTYTKTNKLKTVTSLNAARNFTYDANDNLKVDALTIEGYALQAKYNYNTNDQLISMIYPYSSQSVSFSPDVFGRPTQVSNYVTNVKYWPSGQVQEILYDNGATTKYGQNTRLWPSYFQASKSKVYTNSQYTYDGVGNLTAIADATDTNYRRTLGYDAINRLTTAGGPWGSGSIVYNGSGDITRQTFGSSSLWNYTYDSSNRLSQISGTQPATLTYDAYGDVQSDGRYYYVYDDVPNLRCASTTTPCSSSAYKTEYIYDGLNHRASVNQAGVKTYEFYDNKGQILVELNPKTKRLVEYFYLGNQRVAQRVTTP